MFKSLRNKLFITYLISMIIILSGSMSFIYMKSAHDMDQSINMRLDINKRDGKPGDKPIRNKIPNNSEIGSEGATVDFQRMQDQFIIENKDDLAAALEQLVGTEAEINSDKQLISSGDQTYKYNQSDGTYKVVNITYDLEYIANLRHTLIGFGTLIAVAFAFFGFLIINRLVKPIEQSYQIQNRFVSDASHELKTPLAVIKSCLQLIANQDEDSENLVEYCQTETDRLIRLTGDLLQLSESDQMEYPLIDISKQIELLISGLEVGLFEQQIDFSSQIAPNIQAKMASDDINQLIHILIDNAVKYNDNRRKVDLKLTLHNKQIRLVVSNSTELITEKDLDLLFDRFYRIDQSRTEKGFGLGLSLAKHITSKYKGEIKAEYESGYFTIVATLPAGSKV